MKEALQISFNNYYEEHSPNPWTLLKRRHKRSAKQDVYPRKCLKRAIIDAEREKLNPFDILITIDFMFLDYFELVESKIFTSDRIRTWPYFLV